MQIIDSHFHWWPRSVFETLCKRRSVPRAQPNSKGCYTMFLEDGADYVLDSWPDWFDLDKQFEHMDGLRDRNDGAYQVSAVGSIGPFSVYFSALPAEEGRDLAIQWNEEMAWAQRRYPGRFWGSAAIPMQDTRIALEVLEDAIGRLGLMGVNLPGSVGKDARIDAPRLEPYYARVAELGLPMFLHPTDAIFNSMLDGYDGALFLSLGRVVEVSVAGSRLVLSGLMEKYPDLKIVMSHTGGALPYQSGRMDKNTKKAKLPRPTSEYLHRMYTDTVSPHAPGMKFAIDYYGIDRVMYGTDYPCWDPQTCLDLIEELDLSAADRQKLLHDNACRILNLKGSQPRSLAAE